MKLAYKEYTGDLSQEMLNKVYGHKGRFFDKKENAITYYKIYKQRHPFEQCFLYTIKNKHRKHFYNETGRTDFKLGSDYVEGYLVSTPDGQKPRDI
jgi:hypothetical protein